MIIDVRQKYPHCAWRCEWSESFGPLHDHDRVGVVKDLFKTETIQRACLDSIEINVINRHAA